MRKSRLPLMALVAALAFAACGGAKSSSTAGSRAASPIASAAAGMPDCRGAQPVWVNLRTKKYHEPGDRAYGHTKQGEYLCAAQAEQQGFMAAGHGGRSHHRRHRHESGGGYESGDQTGASPSPGDN